MLPCVAPCAVGGHVAYGVAMDRFPVPPGQQVTPCAVIAVRYRGGCACRSCFGGVGVFLLGKDIARIVIGPIPGGIVPSGY